MNLILYIELTQQLEISTMAFANTVIGYPIEAPVNYAILMVTKILLDTNGQMQKELKMIVNLRKVKQTLKKIKMKYIKKELTSVVKKVKPIKVLKPHPKATKKTPNYFYDLPIELQNAITKLALPKKAPKKEKKTKDVFKPKKPLTAYNVFCNMNRARVSEENLGLNRTEITKKLREMWTHLKKTGVMATQPYIDMAALDKERFQREMDAHYLDHDDTDYMWGDCEHHCYA